MSYNPPKVRATLPNDGAYRSSDSTYGSQSNSSQKNSQSLAADLCSCIRLPQQKISREGLSQRRLRTKLQAGDGERTDAPSVHLEDTTNVAPPDSAKSFDYKAIFAEIEKGIASANDGILKHPERAAEFRNRLEMFKTFKAAMAEVEKHGPTGTDSKSADHSVGVNSGQNLSQPHGQPHALPPNHKEQIAHNRERENEVVQQGMASNEAHMASQAAISSFQSLNATVTAFSQAANANIAATCNMMLDCVKAIHELLKKGGNAMSSAISG